MMEVVCFLFVFCFDITTEIWIINSCQKLKTNFFGLAGICMDFFQILIHQVVVITSES